MKHFTRIVLIVAKCIWVTFAGRLSCYALRIRNTTLPTYETDVPDGRIVGGHEAKPYSHPYIVSLQMRFLWARVHFCGGSLLNENWVLTAGHCLLESWIIRWLPMDAVAGAHNVNNFGPKAQVATIAERIAHPQYKGGIGVHDIGLLKTKWPFVFTNEIQPINLPRANIRFGGESMSLSGWGVLRTTTFFPDLPDRLQEVTVTYLPHDKCNKAINAILDPGEVNPLDKDSHICTGPITGGVAACSGDSGGPLSYLYDQRKLPNKKDPNTNEVDTNNEDDLEYEFDSYEYRDDKGSLSKVSNRNTTVIPIILGVVSFGASPCGQNGAPSVYTKVSSYLDFINSNIN